MEEREKWLDAVEQFRLNIDVVISCPSCNYESLKIRDIAFDESDKNKGGERFIECSKCGRFEIVLYRKIPENWSVKNAKK
jgi:uncharacterized Zn finger protein